MNDRYVTRDPNIATFLVHTGGRDRRVVILIADDGRPVYSFADSPSLQADVIRFTQGARVTAMEYGQAMRVIAKLTREAHYRRSAVHRRVIEGRDVSQMHFTRHAPALAAALVADEDDTGSGQSIDQTPTATVQDARA